MLKFTASLFLLPAFCIPVLGQSVHVVDEAGSPGSFAEVSDALLAAANGDLVLIKPGMYQGFSINDLAVTIIADGPGVTFASDVFFGLVTVSVFNLSAGRVVNLAGFSIEQLGGTFGFQMLHVQSCDGPVMVRDCNIVTDAPGTAAALVQDSNAVSLVDSIFDAALVPLGYAGTDDAHALSTEDSNTFVYGCILASGSGAEGDHLSNPPLNDGGPGPAGWRVLGGFGLAVRTTIDGGRGGKGAIDFGAGCGVGGMGGPGLNLLAGLAAPAVTLSQVSVQAGPGGFGGLAVFGGPDCDDGPPGPVESVTSGSLTGDSFETRALETEFLARVGQMKTERFIGEPGDLIWHVYGINAVVPVYVPEITGALVVGNPYFIRFRGLVPASGEKVLSVLVPDIGVAFVVLYEQAFFYDFTRFYISNPQFSVLLDD